MREGRAAIGIILLSFLSVFFPAYSQQAREQFGKNRVQYKVFDWRFFTSDNFDVYFYEGGEEAASEAINFLETEFDRITDVIGYSPYTKTKVFLYNSVGDLQQSNVGINDLDYSAGGQTDFIKSYVEIAHPGTISGFRHDLVYNISRLLINDMMFGGSLTDMFQSAYLLHLPTWFVEGASAYIANGWSLEMDDFIRDFVDGQSPKKLSRLIGDDARFAGQSIWNFISQKYGQSSISNILNLTRIIRNEEKSISNTLGLSFRKFLKDWQDFYLEIQKEVAVDYQNPDGLQVLGKNRKGYKYTHLQLSPDATKLAYVRNYNGRYSVWIRDLNTQNEDRIMSGGYKVINQKVDYDSPLLSWADNSTLGIVNYVKSKTTLWLFDITTRNKIPTRFERFEKVHSFSFSGNGRLAIMSADVDGVNDLYLVSVTRSRIKRLTNDLYDETYPTFIPNSNIILFSSNRQNDTLNIIPESIEEVSTNFNLFLYNLDTTRLMLTRVTNTVSRDVNPRALNYSDFYYLSDQKGIQNIFKYDLRDSIYSQVSNYSNNIRQYDINFAAQRAAYILDYGNESNIYVDYNFDKDRSIFTSITRLQRENQARISSTRRENLSTQSNPVQLDFTKKEDIEPDPTKKDIIDTDNYVFDKEVEAKQNIDQPESFLSQYRRFQTEKTIFGPLDYETRFSADNLVTSWVIDPMIGFGVLIETQMKDILEDHSFKGSAMGTTDFRSGDFIGEYNYLRGMIDIGFRFYRRVMEWSAEDIPQKYKKNVIELSASYPISVRTRFTVRPFFGNTKFEDLDFRLLGPGPGNPATVNRNYLGVKSELVFDNSISKGMNIIEGTRAKIAFKHWEGLSDKNTSFSNVSVDIRHYQKISREFVFATRIYYGRFFGRNAQSYLLGGVDNWLFAKTKNRGDSENQGSPLYTSAGEDNSNLLFLEYVTPLRGFSYNTFFGTDALVLNAELRLPIIKYFYKGPISSNFFRNLQFIGFYDIGSAWTGANPFSEKNEVNTLVIDSGLFKSEIKNYRSPWLQSFGAGLRTVILGFFMKFDLAYPVENFERGKPKFQASFGFDF